MKKARLTIRMEPNTRSNFHNAGPISVIVDLDDTVEYEGDTLVCLSDNQVRRISDHYCGIDDCCCGSGCLVEWDFGRWGIPLGLSSVSLAG